MAGYQFKLFNNVYLPVDTTFTGQSRTTTPSGGIDTLRTSQVQPYGLQYPPVLSTDTLKLSSDVFQKDSIPTAVPFNVTNTESTTKINTSGVTATKKVPPSGTSDPDVLAKAPSPNVKIAGVDKKAKFVVDLKTNTLYSYDENGEPIKAYLIASGKRTGKNPTPTHTGIRVITHSEKSPYTGAYGTKRKQNPKDYGPMCIILRIVDPKTGETSSTGEFIHGNNNYNSLGKYASGGCMRMDNKVIERLAMSVKRGDIVLIK